MLYLPFGNFYVIYRTSVRPVNNTTPFPSLSSYIYHRQKIIRFNYYIVYLLYIVIMEVFGCETTYKIPQPKTLT